MKLFAILVITLSSVCTPTRAAMMTGQSPARLRLANHAPENAVGLALKDSPLQEAENIRHLPLAAVTIAERLSAAGFATAHIDRVIHSSRSVGFTGWIGGVAVFNRAFSPEEPAGLARLRSTILRR